MSNADDVLRQLGYGKRSPDFLHPRYERLLSNFRGLLQFPLLTNSRITGAMWFCTAGSAGYPEFYADRMNPEPVFGMPQRMNFRTDLVNFRQCLRRASKCQ